MDKFEMAERIAKSLEDKFTIDTSDLELDGTFIIKSNGHKFIVSVEKVK